MVSGSNYLTQHYSYYDTGNVYVATNVNGATTTYTDLACAQTGYSITDTFQYDGNTGRMTQYSFNTNTANDTGSLTWNANGTLGQLVIADTFPGSQDSQSCNNTYDDLARLLTNNCGSIWNQAFSYDPFGNISFTGTLSFQPTYSTSTNRYSSLPAGTPHYDGNGNMTGYDGQTYTWDSEGKPVGTSAPSRIYYDPFGRVAETYLGSTAVTTDAVYGPAGTYIGASPGTGSSVGAWVTIPLPGGASGTYYEQASWSSPNSRYLHADWLGTTRLETDAGTGVFAVTSGAFSPFGQPYAGSAPGFFTGAGMNDHIAGWTFPARNQLPDQGRWMSPDPAGLSAVDTTNPQTWNRYAYVGNNPLSRLDPSGLSCVTLDNGSFADNGDGAGCEAAGVSPGPVGDPSTINQRQINSQINGNSPDPVAFQAIGYPQGWNNQSPYINSNSASIPQISGPSIPGIIAQVTSVRRAVHRLFEMLP